MSTEFTSSSSYSLIVDCLSYCCFSSSPGKTTRLNSNDNICWLDTFWPQSIITVVFATIIAIILISICFASVISFVAVSQPTNNVFYQRENSYRARERGHHSDSKPIIY